MLGIPIIPSPKNRKQGWFYQTSEVLCKLLTIPIFKAYQKLPNWRCFNCLIRWWVNWLNAYSCLFMFRCWLDFKQVDLIQLEFFVAQSSTDKWVFLAVSTSSYGTIKCCQPAYWRADLVPGRRVVSTFSSLQWRNRDLRRINPFLMLHVWDRIKTIGFSRVIWCLNHPKQHLKCWFSTSTGQPGFQYKQMEFIRDPTIEQTNEHLIPPFRSRKNGNRIMRQNTHKMDVYTAGASDHWSVLCATPFDAYHCLSWS